MPAESRELLKPAFPPDRDYAAFELRDNAERLHIVRATQPALHLAYHYLADISEDHADLHHDCGAGLA